MTASKSYLESVLQTQALPRIQNELALAGLGTSGALQSELESLAGQYFGGLANLLGTEQQIRAQTSPLGLQMGLGALETPLRLMGLAPGFAQATQALGESALAPAFQIAQMIPALQQQGFGRIPTVSGLALPLAGLERQLGQTAEDAAYQNMLRQQALVEQFIFGTFTGGLPSALGSRATTARQGASFLGSLFGK